MAPGVDEEKRATLRRFAAIGAVSPFARAADDSPGDSDAREAIVGYLGTTPGAHFSKVRDDLRLGTGETQHHLRRLVDAGAIEGHRDGDYRRFYPAGRFTTFEQTALGYLRRETARGLVIGLLREPDASGSDLAAALSVSPSTISRQAADLADAGLLERDDGYRLVDSETLLVLLVRFADSFDGEAVALAADAADLIRLEG